MKNDIEVTGITVKIGEKLVCLTIEDARDLLRKLGDVIKEDSLVWEYEEVVIPNPWPDIDSWTEDSWTGDVTHTGITITSE